MKIKIIDRRTIIFIIVVSILFLYYLYSIYMMKNVTNLRHIASCIFIYAQLNDGQFPAAEIDLFESDLIKQNKNKYMGRHISGTDYLVFQDGAIEKTEWSELFEFENYIISYGSNIDDLEERNGKLYRDNVRFYFIKGPGFVLYRKFYKTVNLELYHVIRKLNEETKKKLGTVTS